MKYFLDTEFIEGTQKKWFGKTKPTIDLISIGIVSEDSREYYAISKDFNLKEAWNRYQIKPLKGIYFSTDYFGMFNGFYTMEKEYWIRENVLRPIYYEMIGKDISFHDYDKYFTYKRFKKLLESHGKTNKQIAAEVKDFISQKKLLNTPSDDFATHELKSTYEGRMKVVENSFGLPEFYTYYGAYDWVVFCWLFGKMIDLPKGFPMFSWDLKVMLDDYVDKVNSGRSDELMPKVSIKSIKENNPRYPKQSNEHNALDDARWNKELYNFLNIL